MLGGRVRFNKMKHGYFVRATRVPQGSRGPPAMVAPVLRPSPHSTPSPRRNRASGVGVGSGMEEQRRCTEPEHSHLSEGTPRLQSRDHTPPSRAPRNAAAGVCYGAVELESNHQLPKQTQRSPRQQPQPQYVAPQRHLRTAEAGAGVRSSGTEEHEQEQTQRSPPHQWLSSQPPPPQRRFPSPGAGAAGGGGAVETRTHLDQAQRISSPQSPPQRHFPSPGAGAGRGSAAEEQQHYLEMEHHRTEGTPRLPPRDHTPPPRAPRNAKAGAHHGAEEPEQPRSKAGAFVKAVVSRWLA